MADTRHSLFGKSKYEYKQTMWQWGFDKSLNGGVDGDLCFVDYPAITAEFYKNHGGAPDMVEPPVIPKEDTNASGNIKIGDIVQFKGGSVYISSTVKTASVTKGASRCEVSNIYSKGTHKYHLISQDGKGVYGWVNASDVEGAEIPAPSGGNTTVKVGDIVQFKGGNVYISADASTASAVRGFYLDDCGNYCFDVEAAEMVY